MKYQLKVGTLAIDTTAGTTSPVVIPSGAVLERLGEEDGFARCAWEGRIVLLLKHDLQQRGVAVDHNVAATE